MDDDYQNPIPGKTYISPSLQAFGNKERRVRIASKILPSEYGYEYVKERDEVVLRKKPDAKTHITAKFLEDSREAFVLAIQKFVTETGQPYGSGFSFVGEEIGRFCEFLANIQSVDFQNRARVNISDEELRRIALTSHQAKSFLSENLALFAEVLRSEVTTEDLVVVGFRRKQLSVYRDLLDDQSYFENVKLRKNCSSEALWQSILKRIHGYSVMG